MEYTPITPSKATLKMWTKADLKLGFLPLIILNKSARIFAFDYFEKIVEKAKEYKGSEWEKKVAAHPAMYEYFQQKTDEYFK